MEDIDLKEILMIFWEKKATILLIIAIFMVLGFIYSSFILVPEYSSYTTLLLAQSQSANGSTGITATDLTLNSKLISTYSSLVKSTTVIRKVISNLGIEDDEQSIKDNVTVTSESNTEIIKITVTNINADKAAQIANEIAVVFTDEVKRLYNIDNVHIVDPAEVSLSPSNLNRIRDIVIFGLVGLVISAIYIFITFLMDNSIKSQEDIEKSLNITVLANIPVYEIEGDKNKRKTRKKVKGGKRK